MRLIITFRSFAALAALALALALPAVGFARVRHHVNHQKTHHVAKHHGFHARSAAATTESSAPESGAATEAPGAPEADGPGGHQDNPNDPNADHQFNGAE